MAIRNVGEMEMDAMDDMNIPVCCFLCEPEGEGRPWTWHARNFMPRKEYCGSSWSLEADTKEELIEFVNQRVVPLYEAALNNLKQLGQNYYWEPKT